MTCVKERGMRMEYATRDRVWWFGPKNHRWTVFGFGPQNPGGGSEEERGGTWWNHRGCVEAKQLSKGSVSVRSIDLELDHNASGLSGSAQNIWGKLVMCNSPINKGRADPTSPISPISHFFHSCYGSLPLDCCSDPQMI